MALALKHCHDIPSLLSGEVGMNEAPPLASMLTQGLTRAINRVGQNGRRWEPPVARCQPCLPRPGRPLIHVASGLLRLSLPDSHPVSLPDSRDVSVTCQHDLEPHPSPADIPGTSHPSSNSLRWVLPSLYQALQQKACAQGESRDRLEASTKGRKNGHLDCPAPQLYGQ